MVLHILRTHIDQTSTLGPYFLLERSSGAAYAGLPHCVLKGSEYPRIPAQLLRPKSVWGNRERVVYKIMVMCRGIDSK